MAQKYYGLKSYCSLNNPNYVSFLQELGIFVVCPLSIDYYKALGITPKGIVGADLNYINGVGDNYKLMGYLGVKYLLMQSGTSINSEHLNYLGSMNNIDVYENKGAYPIGFINYAVMSKEEFDHLDNDNKVDALCNFTIVENDAITECTDVYDTKHTVIESARKNKGLSNYYILTMMRLNLKYTQMLRLNTCPLRYHTIPTGTFILMEKRLRHANLTYLCWDAKYLKEII